MDQHLHEKWNAVKWSTNTTGSTFVVELGGHLLDQLFWYGRNHRLQIVVIAGDLVQINSHQLLTGDRVVSQLVLELCRRCI